MVLAGLLALAAVSSGAATKTDLKWLDREFSHYLMTPHRSETGLPALIETSAKFREHIFVVDPVRRGPNSPTWRFMTQDFAERLRVYEEKNQIRYVGSELRRILAEINYPFALSADELRDFRAHPERKRFGAVWMLKGIPRSAAYLRENDMFHIRDVIAQVRSQDSDFYRKLSSNELGQLKVQIDRTLQDDQDAEFCVLDLGDATKVSREKLEREGFRLKPKPTRLSK